MYGADGNVFAADTNGNLFRYKLKYNNGVPYWAVGNGGGQNVGSGWFQTSLLAGTDGTIFRFMPDGTLLRYRWVENPDGSLSWPVVAQAISSGWTQNNIIAMANGYLLRTVGDGTMYLYRYSTNGNSFSWLSVAVPISYGWGQKLLAAGQDSTILRVLDNGDVWRYRFIPNGNTGSISSDIQKIGEGWIYKFLLGFWQPNTTKYYNFGGANVATRKGDSNGSLTYIHPDHLGSLSLATDAMGNVIYQARYKPYGEIRYSSGSSPSDLTYTGQRSEGGYGISPGPGSGSLGSVMDFGARPYSPFLGRFLSPDSIVPGAGNSQALNRYSYGLNNPVKYRDPSGHDPRGRNGDGEYCGQDCPDIDSLVRIAMRANPDYGNAKTHVRAITRETARQGVTNRAQVAYILSTAQHESLMGRFMNEICCLSGNANFEQQYGSPPTGNSPDLAKGLGNTEPGDGERYFGRGYIQVTGRRNYEKLGKLVGENLVAKPYRAASPEVASIALVYGMKTGMYTGVGLSNFTSATGVFDAFSARSIVNGDKDRGGPPNSLTVGSIIAGISRDYEAALTISGLP